MDRRAPAYRWRTRLAAGSDLMPLAAWQISGGKPVYLDPGVIELEKVLEDWIAENPGLIDRNLLVIHRQLHVEGGVLDLLCVDLQGRATVVEIKRGRLIRETIAQAIDYASNSEERESLA
jgi:Endonuclease NucS C-terminal domain